MKAAICFDKVSKFYRIGSSRSNLREAVSNALARLSKRSGSENPANLWALQDVSFEVGRGETLGLIGPNGAGKTTVLKLLANVTQPTFGTISIGGRLAALIELGAGFHPDLTGRENVYLNGVILGMTRREIGTRFDSIVEFAGLHRFIDTPVKRYSSGMYVRLGFSIAVHINPEVLLIDEVLAVGDIAFQNKSFARIQSFRDSGASIVLVSHNLSAITALCDKVIWLNQGQIAGIGRPAEVIEAYLEDFDRKQRRELVAQLVREDIGTGELRITGIELFDQRGQNTTEFHFQDDIGIRVHYLATRAVNRPYFMISVNSDAGSLFAANMLFDSQCPDHLEGEGVIECVFKSVSLLPGTYQIIGGVRGPSGVLHIVRPRPWGSFSIVSPISEYGFRGDFGAAVSRVSTPVIVPYEWHFQGTRFAYEPRCMPVPADALAEGGSR